MINMQYEIIRIEGKEKADPYSRSPFCFEIAECRGRAGCFVEARGFAVPISKNRFGLSPGWLEIARDLETRGIKQGQKAVVRITRTYPAGEQVYFKFTAT